MKKRIVALVSALTLVFAMSINAAAAGSITAEEVTEIQDAAGDVYFPSDKAAMEDSADYAESCCWTEEAKITELTSVESAKALAKEVGTMAKKDSVEKVEVYAVFEITADTNEVTFFVGTLADNKKAVILHQQKDGSVEEIVGDYFVDDRGYGAAKFTFKNGFSPAALVIVTEKAAAAPAASDKAPQPAYNPAWDPTSPSYIGNTNASAPAAAPVAALVAPKTGDVVMMVSIMAIIFMAGAAVAVAMSKKRA